MASTYPGALDTFSAIPATLAGPPTHEELHEELSNGLAAVQAELGTDPAGSAATVAARLAAMGWGRVTSASSTSTQSGITTAVDVTGLSVTFTADSGRRYRITARTSVLSSVAGDIARLDLVRAGSTLISTCQSRVEASAVHMIIVHELSGVSGSQTVKVQLGRTGGSGNLSTAPASTSPAMLLVEDIGPT